jgi:hypothetical protein
MTESLGYEANGTFRSTRRDRPAVNLRYRMGRSHFDTLRRDDIVVTGVEAVREMLGLSAP